jgi:hypothetical protein
MDMLKRCCKCAESKPVAAFYDSKRWRDGKHPWCKTCFLASCKARYEQRCTERPPTYRWHRDLVRHDYFAHVEMVMQAYLLGFLAADGNVLTSPPRVSVELSIKDRDLLCLMRDELAPGHTLRERRRGGMGTQNGTRVSAMLSFTSPQMVQDLARYSIVPAKSRVLRWPTALPTHLARPFVLGYFDGDGFITSAITRTGGKSYHYHYLGICSGSHGLLLDILDVVQESSGVRMGGPWRRAGTECYTVRMSGQRARIIDEWLHSDGLGLARKRLPPIDCLG